MLAKPKKIHTSAGVYTFRRGGTSLYIGKALNLKKRLASYFQKRAALPMKIQRMLQEATRLETIETASEIEALLKEAELIKKYRPKYNLLMRDDKSYFYVAISKEAFPKIFITHQPRPQTRNPKPETRNKSKIQNSKYVGPFTSGTALKATLKLLRRVFPYCTCKKLHKRTCLNSEIGRCPGYCCLESKKSEVRSKKYRIEYRKNIRNVVAVLEGKRTRLIASLKRQMKEAAKQEKFEQAARLRDAVFGLEDVFRHRQVLHTPEARYPWLMILGKLQALLKTKRGIRRIEGYDISNISGHEATGSMVVFINGQPDKSQYRKFRIKTVYPVRDKPRRDVGAAAPLARASNGVKGISDVDMLKEVISRRFRHAEWPYPQLVVIDGGKPQLNATLLVLRKSEIRNPKSEIPIVTALAKREEILFLAGGRSIPLRRQDPALLHLFQRIRDESHRFARAYHHKLRKKHFAKSAKP